MEKDMILSSVELESLLSVPDGQAYYEVRQTPPSTNTAILLCNDPWYRKPHEDFLRGEMGFGKVRGIEDFLVCPVLGGGAIFAHPDVAAAQFETLRDTLTTLRQFFGTITNLVAIGHFGCRRMQMIYEQMRLPLDSGIDYVRRDLIVLARAFEARHNNHVCAIGQLFREFDLDLKVYYLRPGLRGKEKVLWFEKIEPHFE